MSPIVRRSFGHYHRQRRGDVARTRASALNVVVAAFPFEMQINHWPTAKSDIDRHADRALAEFYATSDKARVLARRARAVLAFPHVAKAGVLSGSCEGDGVMRIGGVAAAHYRIVTVAHPRVQDFALAFFFISASTLDALGESGRRVLGTNANLIVDSAACAQITDGASLTHEAYTVPYRQPGLMSHLGLEGARIFRVHPFHPATAAFGDPRTGHRTSR